MKNYAKGKPVGNNQVPFFDAPAPITALATAVRDNAVASSILTLTDDTTLIEVAATNGPAYVKWLTQAVVDSSVAGTSVISAAGTANFDNVVPKDTVRTFIVPIAFSASAEAQGSVVGVNVANGLYKNVAIKSGPIASVATTQY